MAKRVAFVLGVTVLISSGTYVFVYLYRWEWNRALMAAALFIAIEVALLAISMVERMRAMSKSIEDLAHRRSSVPDVEVRLRQSAPEPKPHFAWLRADGSQLGVFVPVLMGTGIVLSGLAWLVERVANRTAGPVLERGLASRLSGLALPAALIGPEPDADDALLLGPAWPAA